MDNSKSTTSSRSVKIDKDSIPQELLDLLGMNRTVAAFNLQIIADRVLNNDDKTADSLFDQLINSA